MNEAIPVLVVDDDTSIQGIVAEILIENSFQPTIASSGEEAIGLLGVEQISRDHHRYFARARLRQRMVNRKARKSFQSDLAGHLYNWGEL